MVGKVPQPALSTPFSPDVQAHIPGSKPQAQTPRSKETKRHPQSPDRPVHTPTEGKPLLFDQRPCATCRCVSSSVHPMPAAGSGCPSPLSSNSRRPPAAAANSQCSMMRVAWQVCLWALCPCTPVSRPSICIRCLLQSTAGSHPSTCVWQAGRQGGGMGSRKAGLIH